MSRFSHFVGHNAGPIAAVTTGIPVLAALGPKGSGTNTQQNPGSGTGNVPWEDGYQNFFSGANGNNAETNYSSYVNSLTPDQLLKRYQNATQADVGASQGILGTTDANNFQAYSTFKSLFGRAPTSNELSQILPAFQGPNGKLNGGAFLANMQNQYKSNPNLDPMSSINQQKPGDINASVSQQFKGILGRDATPDELQHFSQAIQSGQTDAYGLSSFLKQMPEYTNAQDAKFRGGLNTELQGYDTTEFNNEKGDVMSAYAKNGMTGGSSPSLDYALTDLMGKIASNRSAYLSQLSASQYGGNKDLAIGNYQNSLNQMNQNNQGMRQNQQAYGSQLMNQGFGGADYTSQMNDYLRMMNGANQSRNVLHGPDYLNMGFQGINAGIKAYGASKMGGGYDYLNA